MSDIIIDCALPTLELIRSGVISSALAPAGTRLAQVSAGQRVCFRHRMQSTWVSIQLVEPECEGGQRLVHFAQPWTHGDGDDMESILAKIERASRRYREAAHECDSEKQRSAARDLHSMARLLYLYHGGDNVKG